MIGIKQVAALGLAIGISVPALSAQRMESARASADAFQFAIGYSYMRANAAPGHCGCFNLSGGSAEAAVRLWKGFAAVGNVTGEHAGGATVPGQTLSLVFMTGGPRFTYRNRHMQRLSPFVQALAGSVHGFDAPFPTASGVTSYTANSLAVFAGGGLDIALGHHLAIRPIQADYVLTRLPNNANNRQNLFRYAGGIVFYTR